MEIVHVLTLDKRTDRLLSVSQQAKKQGFGVYFHNGIDAEERKDTKKAICMGHKSIVQYAKDNNLPYIVAAEDDVIFFAEGAFKYYMDNMPKDFQLYCGVIYNGEVDNEFRIKNGMSGTHTLITYHNSFYDFILNEMPDDCHCDRYAGDFAWKYKYYVCNPMVCEQSGGWSDNIKMNMKYDVYLEGKSLYGR